MPNVWIWNIDRAHQQFFSDELKQGRLRQGWGYDDQLDLRLIKQKNQNAQPLDEDERAAWTRLNMLTEWVQKGDIVVVKNTPTWGLYTLAEVVDGYHYDRSAPGGDGDFGHWIGVKTLVEVDKHSVHVPGDLRTSIDRARYPVTVAVKRAAAILGLLTQPGDELRRAATWQIRVEVKSRAMLAAVKDIVSELHAKEEFEEVIKNLLELQKFENLQWTSGAGENGADIVMSVNVPFLGDINIVVQVKKHTGVDNDTTSIDQLRRAFDYYKAVAGLLVTSAETLGPQLIEAVEKLKTEGKTVAVLYGDELYRLLLHLFASDSGDRA